MVPLQNRVYQGVDRRSSGERRRWCDRRNSARAVSANIDRRIGQCRRKEDMLWQS